MQKDVVEQIRQYHSLVSNADKTITDAGRQQIEAAYKCGQLLVEEKAYVRSGHWGRFCEKCGMSEDKAGRYIKLYKSAGLRELIQKYRTLNSAYQGEGITSPQRQRITIKAVGSAQTPPPSSGNKSTVAHRSGGKLDLAPVIADVEDGINLKAKVKGFGTLGDLLKSVPPAVRADIESQLRLAADGGTAQKSNQSLVSPADDAPGGEPKLNHRLINPMELGGDEIAGLFQGPLLVDALLVQLKQCAETEDPAEIDACVSFLKPVVEWYQKHAAMAEAVAA